MHIHTMPTSNAYIYIYTHTYTNTHIYMKLILRRFLALDETFMYWKDEDI